MTKIYERTADITSNVQMMVRYKAWANQVTFRSLDGVPPEELTRQRQTNFGSIAHTLNHLLVVDRIFQAHLEDRPHDYTARNTQETPPIDEIKREMSAMDVWYVEFADRLSAPELAETIHFQFVGGGDGRMTREEILLHVVNHGTYHRGFVSDMMYQIPARPTANDLPVFLRDVWYA